MKTSSFLRFAVISSMAAFLCSCATDTKGTAGGVTLQRVQNVRTTAYTHSETGGHRNAVGIRLSNQRVKSAASDWSRFPLGTHFRIAGTTEEFVIDDYGGALIGTSTIDLYKASRMAVRNWGVRHIDIDILRWGSSEESLKVLRPRKGNRLVRRMIAGLEMKKT